MPANKSANLRYKLIDGCLTNTMHQHPSKDYIIKKIEDYIGNSFSDSMFNKDLKAMRDEFNAPIEYCRNKRGYYYSEPGFSIMKFPLTLEEIEALDFSTALLQLKDSPIFFQFENAINKIIEGYRINKLIGKSEKDILQIEKPVKTDSHSWVQRILKSIVEKECLKITYQPFGREKKQHLFSAYLLKEYRNRWYAVGHSNPSEKIITLALDRITNIEASDKEYVSDNSFDPANYFKYSFGITVLGKPEKVQLRFIKSEAEYILTQPLHHSQKVISESNKGLVIQLEVHITQELIQTILGYSEHVKVLKPKKLKQQITNILKQTLRKYPNCK